MLLKLTMNFDLQCIVYIFIATSIVCIDASVGDKTPFFKKCWDTCCTLNCTSDGELYKPILQDAQPAINKMLFWSCKDECQYECMWKTVVLFKERRWDVPQFFGKWPFVRIFGIQELGSVIGSLFNLLIHYISYRKLKQSVRGTHPLLWLWQFFAWVCLNAWIWSTIFHTRDTDFTEFMDYACAFSMVVIVFYCFGMRVLYGKTKAWGIIFSCICGAYFINHTYYLYSGKIDYGHNMIANIVAGMLGGVGWFVWSSVQLWRGRHYVWRCLVFVVLTAASLLLELGDFPPVLQFWDAHAIWHMSTAPLPFLFYRFIIDDCNHMKKKKEQKVF